MKRTVSAVRAPVQPVVGRREGHRVLTTAPKAILVSRRARLNAATAQQQRDTDVTAKPSDLTITTCPRCCVGRPARTVDNAVVPQSKPVSRLPHPLSTLSA